MSFEPVRIVEHELADEPAAIARRGPNGREYGRALLLAGLHGVPLGVVETELPAAGLGGGEARRIVEEALAAEIAAHRREDGTPAGGRPGCEVARERALAEAPAVTVAVATRDRHDELAACLRSLAAAAGRRCEVIVVDSAPARAADGVVAAVRAETGLDLRYVLEPVPGLAVAHNAALAAARGGIVAFVDDDVLVHPLWLGELARAFALGEDVACVTGAIVPAELETEAQELLEQFGGFSKGFSRLVFDLDNGHDGGPLHPYAAGRFGSGANMAFRTDVLRALGGFDPATGAGTPARGGDDLAAFFAVVASGRKLVYQPSALVRHRHRRADADIRRTTFGYGVGLTAYLTKTVLDEPARLADLAARAPRGVAYALGPRSAKNRRKRPGYPRRLAALELCGMMVGPFAYVRSRRRCRRG